MANGNGGPPPPGAKPPMKKSTRNWLIIGTLAAGGLVVLYIMKSRASVSAATAGANTADQGGVDPATGVPYSEEYGYQGAYGTTPSVYGYVDPSTGAYITGTGASSTVTAPSTNASWAQQVEAYLGQLGYDPTTVAAALGKYLTGQTLSSDQSGIVSAAQGFFGQPPQGAPPTITVPPTGQTPSPGTGKFTAPGGLRLRQIAKELGVSFQTLLRLNPNLRQYTQKTKAIPKGTKVNY
jgi:hypothetical protein